MILLQAAGWEALHNSSVFLRSRESRVGALEAGLVSTPRKDRVLVDWQTKRLLSSPKQLENTNTEKEAQGAYSALASGERAIVFEGSAGESGIKLPVITNPQ